MLTDGIYLAGACQYPKDIPDTVASGGAAAAKVIGLFTKEALESEPMIAYINEKTCVGCLTACGVCPFTAIEEKELENPKTGEKRMRRQRQRGHLQGLRHLLGRLPLRLHQPPGFTDDQILAELDALCIYAA